MTTVDVADLVRDGFLDLDLVFDRATWRSIDMASIAVSHVEHEVKIELADG